MLRITLNLTPLFASLPRATHTHKKKVGLICKRGHENVTKWAPYLRNYPNTNWHCLVTHAQLRYRCLLSAGLVDE